MKTLLIHLTKKNKFLATNESVSASDGGSQEPTPGTIQHQQETMAQNRSHTSVQSKSN